MKTATTTLTLAMTLLFASVTTSFATVVNIDINNGGTPTFVGVGAAPDLGTVWNGVNNPATGQGGSFSSGPLVDSFGGASTVTFGATVAEGSSSWGGGGDLFNDGIRAFNGNSAAFTIGGLNSALTYNIYLYSSNGGGTGEGAAFTITGFGTQNVDGTTGGPGYGLGTDYVVFSGITGVTSLSGTYTNFTNPHGPFNGLQVEAVPEPSSLAMLAFGSVFLWFVKGRRGK
jgi:hypothetical protein